MLISVIAHVNHPLELIDEIARILKTGGEVVIGSCTCSCKHWHNIGGEYKKLDRKPPELTEEAAAEAAAIKALTPPKRVRSKRPTPSSAPKKTRIPHDITPQADF